MAGVQAGHQHAPRRGAHGRAGIKIGEPHASLGQAVNVWRLDELLSVATQVAITKVIRHDVNDIGLRPVRSRDFGRRGGRKHVQKKRTQCKEMESIRHVNAFRLTAGSSRYLLLSAEWLLLVS